MNSIQPIREGMLELLDDFTTGMIEEPRLDSKANIDPLAMGNMVELALIAFKAFEEICIQQKMLTGAPAGAERYAFKDLPDNERAKYRSVKHKMDLLLGLYDIRPKDA